jgi:hypothetical protein
MEPSPGAIGFSHSTGFLAKTIRLGEWLRFRNGDFYNHCFVVDRKVGNDWSIIQAQAQGVTNHALLSDVALGGSYALVPLPANVDPAKLLPFARMEVGRSYGWLSILTDAFRIILPSWFPVPSIRMGRSWICSALVAESLRCGGWLCDWPDVYDVVPSELYAALTRTNIRHLRSH